MLKIHACIVVVLAAGAAHAATITWGAPQGISGDTDVSTSGSLVGAFNVGAPGVNATTVNGVAFAPFALSGTSPSSGSFVFSLSTGFGALNGSPSGAPPFSSLSPSYQTLLSSFAGNPLPAPFTLTLGGLVSGRQYEFQWWTNTSSTSNTLTTATAGNDVTLASNPGNLQGGVGQFAIGTFFADATSQVISFNSTFQPLLNGFQLRDVTPVPEPGAATLFVLGLVGMAILRSRCS